MFEPRDIDAAFCGHCGERLPRFGARLGFCTPCGKTFKSAVHGGGDPHRRSGPPPLPPESNPKDPLLSMVLSTVLPGAGQVYNSHFVKAGLIFVTSPLVIPWLIGIADAYFSARKINGQTEFSTYYGAQPA